jgi:iron(III) transport system ATP-binding protein
MRFEIKDLQRRFGFSILYVTHDQSEAMALSDRILVMRLGVVQQTGTPLEVYGKPGNRFVFEFVGLSSFIETAFDTNGMLIGGASYPWPNGVRPAHEIRSEGRGVLAVRPFEIEFLDPAGRTGVPGIVARKVFLGETIDYRVRVGETEVRVQKTRRVPGPALGESVKLGFPLPHWYRAGED